MYAGGTPQRGHGVLQLEAGFPSLLSLAYHYALSDRFTLGVRASFDYGVDQQDIVFEPTGWVQLALRWSLRRDRLSIGLRCEPGGGVSLAQVASFGRVLATYTVLDVIVPIGFAVEYHFSRVALGAGLDAALLIAIPTTGAALTEQVPLRLGPLFEASLSQNVLLVVDAKAGVLIPTSGNFFFVFRAVAGIAVHL